MLALGFVLALLDWRGSDIIWLFRLRCDFGLSWQTLLLLSTCGKLNRGGLFGFSEILISELFNLVEKLLNSLQADSKLCFCNALINQIWNQLWQELSGDDIYSYAIPHFAVDAENNRDAFLVIPQLSDLVQYVQNLFTLCYFVKDYINFFQAA